MTAFFRSLWSRSARPLWMAIALTATIVPEANAGFVAPYAVSAFSLFNSTADGEVEIGDDGSTLILTGPNDGSGLPGYTTLTIRSRGVGTFGFEFVYTSSDEDGWDYAGYLLNDDFFDFRSLAVNRALDVPGGYAGTVSVPVLNGDLIGFRIDSLDNQNGPGILTISNFSAPAPVPEPGAFWLTFCGVIYVVWRKALSPRSRSRRPISALVIVGILLLALSPPVGAQNQVEYTGAKITGQLTLVRSVNLRQQGQSFQLLGKTAAGIENVPKAPPKRLRPPRSSSFSALAFSAATAKTLLVSAPGTVTGFNGLSHLDQRLANHGNQFSVEPPSQSIAVGNGYALEGVNSAIQVYTSSGAPLLPSVVASNQLFGLGPAIDYQTGVNGVYLTDMRVYFDQDMNRWLVIQRAQDNDLLGNPLAQSHLYIAISKTSDPVGDYLIYIMDTTNASHPGCPCIADYPQIGSDLYGFHIAWNEFNAYGLSFVDAAIMSVSKAALAAGARTPAAYQLTIPFTTGYEFAIQPATTPPGASSFLASGGVEYFVSSMARFSSGGGVALWAVRNTTSLATPSPNLVLMRIIVPTLSYTPPDVATQRAGKLPLGSTLVPPQPAPFLDGGDSRVQSLTYAGARLYLTLQTALIDGNGRWVVGGAYVVISPVLRSNVLSGSIVNQGYLMVNGNHVLRPAIAVNSKGRGAIAVTLTGADWFPTAALIPFESSTTPTTLQIAGLGVLPDDGFTAYSKFGGAGVARWGDYNGAVATADGSIWMVAQYIGDFPRTTYANWNTFIMCAVF